MKKILLSAIALLSIFNCANAEFVLTLKSGEEQTVEGNVSFTQTANGDDWSVDGTSVNISQLSSISLVPETSGLNVGDFFYSDGTWSSELDSAKTPIGIVFYVGNPAVDDEALAIDHPECIHGLVVGLKESRCEWQEDYSEFDYDADGITVGEWIADNTDYVSIATRSESMTSVFNKIMGYNNTLGIDAFNEGEWGWDYEVFVGSKVSSTMSGLTAPASTSGWYVPSVKEVSILCSGNIEGNIGDLGYEDIPDNANMTLINQKLGQINNAAQLGGTYWSSTEYSVSQVHTVQFANGLVMQTSKGGSNILRPILAF